LTNSKLALDLGQLVRSHLTTAEARDLQNRIAPAIEREDRFGEIRSVAGADIALSDKTGFVAFIVYSFPELIEVERVSITGELKFPYVPGLLAFREVPLLLDAYQKLRHKPQLIIADAHGFAHPRRAGMACFLGLALDTPTIGCAKSLLVGKYEMPAEKRGSTSALRDKNEQIGVVLRSRDNVLPIFVSCGHRVSLKSSVKLVTACCDGYRIPRPQREADLWVKKLRQAYSSKTHAR
jgi:deoxyribonuclease V